jgi:hypothetical protein
MLKRLIKNIRQQPKGTRDKIAFGIAGGFTACLLTIWIYQMPARMSAISGSHDDGSSQVFSQFFDEIGDQFAAVKDAIPENTQSEQVSSSSETGQYDMIEFSATTVATSSVSSSTDSVVGTTTSAQPSMASSSDQGPAPTPTAPRAIRVVPVSATTAATTSDEIE